MPQTYGLLRLRVSQLYFSVYHNYAVWCITIVLFVVSQLCCSVYHNYTVWCITTILFGVSQLYCSVYHNYAVWCITTILFDVAQLYCSVYHSCTAGLCIIPVAKNARKLVSSLIVSWMRMISFIMKHAPVRSQHHKIQYGSINS